MGAGPDQGILRTVACEKWKGRGRGGQGEESRWELLARCCEKLLELGRVDAMVVGSRDWQGLKGDMCANITEAHLGSRPWGRC